MTSGLLFTSYFRSPQLTETCDEKNEKFHPLSLYYFRWTIESCEKFASPRLPCDLGSRPRISTPRNLPRVRIKNSQRPPQSTRNKGYLIFHSYSKMDVRAPCVFCRISPGCARFYYMTWHARAQWIACALEMRTSNRRERPQGCWHLLSHCFQRLLNGLFSVIDVLLKPFDLFWIFVRIFCELYVSSQNSQKLKIRRVVN